MSVQGPACVTFSHGLGQNRKSSMRAHVFRFAPKSGHCATDSTCPFRADTVEKVFSGWRTKFFRTADAVRTRRREGPHRFTQKRPRTFVSGLASIAALETSPVSNAAHVALRNCR